MRWFYTAYRLGLWKEAIPRELTRDAFIERMHELLVLGEFDWVIEAPGDGGGHRPIGLMLAVSRNAGNAIEPHIDWFPWATPRNQMEGIAQWLKETSKQIKILVYVRIDESAMWHRLAGKYRILNRGCKILDYFGRGEDAMFFYTPGP